MKHCFLLLALSGLLLQNFSKVFILVNYELNKKYITENLCENRDKPAMHCDGQCHLKKQLDKEDKSEGIPMQSLKEKPGVQICEDFSPVVFTREISDTNFPSDTWYFIPAAPAHSIFQPPRC
jgi:hypothetical protein